MDLNITFIRNAPTKGGMEGRLLGRIDEPLTTESENLLRDRAAQGIYPGAQIVFSGGTMRCLQTASAVYPNMPAIILKELAPFDYGDFSGRTYSEIVADKRFTDWMIPGRIPAFPGGEAPHAFTGRCGKALRHIVREALAKNIGHIGVVTHLCVIKTILHRYCVPRSFYCDWHTDYLGGYAALYNTQTSALQIVERF